MNERDNPSDFKYWNTGDVILREVSNQEPNGCHMLEWYDDNMHIRKEQSA